MGGFFGYKFLGRGFGVGGHLGWGFSFINIFVLRFRSLSSNMTFASVTSRTLTEPTVKAWNKNLKNTLILSLMGRCKILKLTFTYNLIIKNYCRYRIILLASKFLFTRPPTITHNYFKFISPRILNHKL